MAEVIDIIREQLAQTSIPAGVADKIAAEQVAAGATPEQVAELNAPAPAAESPTVLEAARRMEVLKNAPDVNDPNYKPSTPEEQAAEAREKAEFAALVKTGREQARRNTELQQGILSAMIPEQQNMEKAIVDEANATAIIKKQADVAEMQKQVNMENLYTSAGGTNAINNLIAGRKKAADQAISSAEQINNIMDTKITGIGIIDRLINEFRVLGSGLEYQQATDAARVKTYDDAISGMSSAMSNANSMEGQVKRTITEATIAAEQADITAKAQRMLSTARVNALGSNAMMLDRIMKSSAEELQLMTQAEQYAQSFNSAKTKAINEKLKEMQLQSLEDQNLTIDKLKASYKTLGYQMPADAELRYQMGITDPKNRSETFTAALSMATTGKVADTAAEALLHRQKTGTFTNPVWEDIALTAITKKGDKASLSAIGEEMVKAAAAKEKSIVSGDESNWYQFPGIAALAEQEVIKKSKLYNDVLKPQSAGKNFMEILKAADAAVKAGTLKHEEAVTDIVNIFTATTHVNNARNQYNAIGVKNQVKFNAVVDLPALTNFTGGQFTLGMNYNIRQTFDLTNKNAVAQLLLRLRNLP